MKKREKIIIIGICCICLVLLIGSVSYAYIAYYARQKGINLVNTGCVRIEMDELTDAIHLEKSYPLTDEEGKSTTPYRFRVTNTCEIGVDYNINLEILESENRMSSDNIATMLDHEDKKILTNTIATTPSFSKDEIYAVEAFTLYTGSLIPGETKTHNLRLWINENAGNDSQNKVFMSKVVIEAIQNNAINKKFSEYIIGQTETNENLTEFFHEETSQTPATVDYRYVGKNPNNYVYFGCEEGCSEDNLYRIIGVIPTQSSIEGEYKNRVKLIKENIIQKQKVIFYWMLLPQ